MSDALLSRQVPSAVRQTNASPRLSGARSGALIAGASLFATVLNYGFLVAAGRLLGSDDYGALAALLGFLTVVLLPASALQLAVSREVSRSLAVGDREGAEAFSWATLRLGLFATVPVLVLALALAVPLADVLKIDSAGMVVLATGALAAAFTFPIATGVLQGYDRFVALASMYVLPFAIRLGLLAIVAAAGLRLGGAIVATVAAAIAGGVLAVALVREPLRRGARHARPQLGPFLRYLGPVFVGLVSVAVLTNIDLLVVRARFESDVSGEYAAASAFARVAFFLPVTILAVLFPRTAARQARGESADDILGRCLLVTAAFAALLMAAYGVLGGRVLDASFGAEFADGGDLLIQFTLAMGLFALANMLLGFHLSRGEARYAWIVLAVVPVQLAVLALVPSGVNGVIVANIAIGVALIGAHELFVASSVAALAAGWSRLRSEGRSGR